MPRHHLTLLIAAAFAAIFMGTIGTISRFSGLESATVTFFRLGFSVLLINLAVLFPSHRRQCLKRPHPYVLLSGVALAGFMIFYIEAMNHTTMLIAIMTIYLAPALSTLIAHFFFNEPLSSRSFRLLLLVLAGFSLVVVAGENQEALSLSITGMSYALLSLFCYTTFLIFNRIIPKSYPELPKASWQFLIGTLCVAPFALAAGFTLSTPQWGWMFLAGLFPGFLGIALAIYAINRLPTATFATISYLEPIVAASLGWVFFAEALTPLQLIGGGAIIIAGILQSRTPYSHCNKMAVQEYDAIK
ncbi:DMT family transporter [Thaumasiovibrio sp. DFM-14]|uniref:DMT family transporter n=1 Tax=Thaumasiovibrio sp. DFM-14 TaxID=3384792 RepID=UPI0039A1B553